MLLNCYLIEASQLNLKLLAAGGQRLTAIRLAVLEDQRWLELKGQL